MAGRRGLSHLPRPARACIRDQAAGLSVGRQSPAAGRRWRPTTGRQRPRSRAPIAPWRPQVAVMAAPTPCREDAEAQRDSGQGTPTCGPGMPGAVSRSKGRALSSPPGPARGHTCAHLAPHLDAWPIISAGARERVTCPCDTAGQSLSSCQTLKGTSPAPCSHPRCGHCELQLRARGGALLCEPTDKPDTDRKKAAATRQDKGQDGARSGHTPSRP